MFPAAPATHLQAPGELAEAGIDLRWLRDDDVHWLRALYASTREDELAAIAWPPAARETFLRQQFEAQHRHYRGAYPDAQWLAIRAHGAPLGRLYLRRSADADLVVDISLFPGARGRGLGSALLGEVQRTAAIADRRVALHVLQANVRARALYARLGFVADGDATPYLRMTWHPARVESSATGLS